MHFLFIDQSNNPGAPSFERSAAFKEYLKAQGFSCDSIKASRLRVIDLLSGGAKDQVVFLSMPPFRKWWLFFIPGIRVILDIRDGWSIAMVSGYGGLVERRPAKALFARIIERWAIKRSFFTITCTPGLQEYLEKYSKREIYLIPNGVSEADFELAERLRKGSISPQKSSITDVVTFCCAGKFSEYGHDKIKLILDVISTRYSEHKFLIKLFGSDPEENAWLIPYVDKISGGRGKVELVNRLPKIDLYSRLAECDIGISVIRDPDYDFGTKVFDYIALGLPVLNYFPEKNSFVRYFNRYLDKPFDGPAMKRDISRLNHISEALSGVFD